MPLPQDFDVLSEITGIQIIARGVGVDARHYLNRMYGRGRWRKMKGRAWIRLKRSGEEFYAEIHWLVALQDAVEPLVVHLWTPRYSVVLPMVLVGVK
jgi:hypothetical protein